MTQFIVSFVHPAEPNKPKFIYEKLGSYFVDHDKDPATHPAIFASGVEAAEACFRPDALGLADCLLEEGEQVVFSPLQEV